MRRGTENRFICWLIWWFYESHGSPSRGRVLRVYSTKEYFTDFSRHVWIEQPAYGRTLYRAIGSLFLLGKALWDAGEAKLWPPDDKPEFNGGM